ncbi:MAG: hypothetical protein DRP65_09660, partial [Planctomycetota bacterium]
MNLADVPFVLYVAPKLKTASAPVAANRPPSAPANRRSLDLSAPSASKLNYHQRQTSLYRRRG